MDKFHMQMHLRYTWEQYSKTWEYEPLTQIIGNVIDEIQDTNLDTDSVVSTHDGSLDETMQIPYPGKYDYYDPDRPSIQRLYDIGTVINNEAPVDSVQITQNCMKEYE